MQQQQQQQQPTCSACAICRFPQKRRGKLRFRVVELDTHCKLHAPLAPLTASCPITSSWCSTPVTSSPRLRPDTRTHDHDACTSRACTYRDRTSCSFRLSSWRSTQLTASDPRSRRRPPAVPVRKGRRRHKCCCASCSTSSWRSARSRRLPPRHTNTCTKGEGVAARCPLPTARPVFDVVLAPGLGHVVSRLRP